MLKDKQLKKPISDALLLDFYGQLLTEKAYEISDLHYNEDMSLAEIAENLRISRQAVHDSLQRSTRALRVYEDKLGLAKRFLDQHSIAANALLHLDSGEVQAARTELLRLMRTI